MDAAVANPQPVTPLTSPGSSPVANTAPIPGQAQATAAPAPPPVNMSSPQFLGYNPGAGAVGPGASSGAIQAALSSFLNSVVDPATLYNNYLTAYGVPDVRTNVNNLRQQIVDTTNALNKVAPNDQGRLQNSLATQAQLDALINADKQPLTQDLNTEQSNEGVASQNLASLQSQAEQAASLANTAAQQRESSLKDLYTLQYNREQNAAAAKAKASGGGSGGGSGSSKPSIQDVINYYIKADSNYGAYNPHGTNLHRWQAAAQQLQQLGFNTASGSSADKLLKAAFAPH